MPSAFNKLWSHTSWWWRLESWSGLFLSNWQYWTVLQWAWRFHKPIRFLITEIKGCHCIISYLRYKKWRLSFRRPFTCRFTLYKLLIVAIYIHVRKVSSSSKAKRNKMRFEETKINSWPGPKKPFCLLSLLTKYLHLLLPLRLNPIKGHHPNLTWLSPCCLHLCSVFAGYQYFSVAHSVPPAAWPSPAVAWYLSQQIFATPRSCYIGDVKPSIRYSKDVLSWINWLLQPR